MLGGALLLLGTLLALGVAVNGVLGVDGTGSPLRFGRWAEPLAAGIFVLAAIAIPGFVLRLRLDLYVALAGAALVGSIAWILRRGALRAPLGGAAPPARGPLGLTLLEVLAGLSGIAAVLLIGIRYSGGDEVYHLGRIRHFLDRGALGLSNPLRLGDDTPEPGYFVPFFHLIVASLARATGASPREAYLSMALVMTIALWAGIAWLSERLAEGERPSSPTAIAVFRAVATLVAVWLPVVDFHPHQVNYIFPFTPEPLVSALVGPVWLTRTLQLLDRSETRWRPWILTHCLWAGMLLVHSSPIVVVAPALVLAVGVAWACGRPLPPERWRTLAVRFAPVALMAAVYVGLVLGIARNTKLPNEYDPVLMRTQPLAEFDRGFGLAILLLPGGLSMVRVSGTALLLGAAAVAVVALHVRRGGTRTIVWLASPALFAVIVAHNPIVYPLLSRVVSCQFGIRYALEQAPVAPIAALAAAMLWDASGAAAGRRAPRLALAAAALVGFTLLGGLTAQRLATKKGFTGESDPLAGDDALWKAVRANADPVRPLLASPPTSRFIAAFSPAVPYFQDVIYSRMIYADYATRKARVNEALAPETPPARRLALAREAGAWGVLLAASEPTPADGWGDATVVYRDAVAVLLQLPRTAP